MRRILFILLSIVGLITNSQSKKVYLSDLLLEISESTENPYSVHIEHLSDENVGTIRDPWGNLEKESIGLYLKQKNPQILTDESGKVLFQKKVRLTVGVLDDVQLSDLHFMNLELIIDKGEGLTAKNSEFDSLNLIFNKLENQFFFHDNILTSTKITCSGSGKKGNTFWIAGNTLNNVSCVVTNIEGVEVLGNRLALRPQRVDRYDSAYAKINHVLMDYTSYSNDFWIRCEQVNDLTVWLNKSDSSSLEGEAAAFEPFTISGDVSNLRVFENSLAVPFVFRDLLIHERLEVLRNEFTGYKGLGLYRVIFPELFININWRQFEGNLLYVNTDIGMDESADGFASFGHLPYFGTSIEEMRFEDRFRQLLDAYSKFYRYYKESGDIEASNSVFQELQGFHTLRYEYLYENFGGLNNLFRWRLNQLQAFYTNYGTDPAKAIVISIYLIFVFAIFYFFFPSEWDVTPKAQLLRNLRNAFNKKKSGFLKPLSLSLYNVLLSFLNAVTLSVNAFVTLGFGAIPTKGIARYVCVIQGFIGWFLLSIFLVALLNQVSF